MAIVTDIDLVPLEFRMPEAKAYGMARGLTAVRQCSIIRLRTDDGAEGIGETWGPCRAAAAYLDLIKGHFIGRPVYDHELVAARIFAKHYHFGIQNQMLACLSGLNVAALDAIGHLHGLPVHDLIGGKGRDRIPVYASGGYVTHDPDNGLDAQMERLVGRGFPAVKIKIGLNPDSDEERVARTRDILGDDILLLVDANGNYTVDLALMSMDRIADYDIHWYEEPLPPQDVAGLKRLHDHASMPIATGEALYTVFDFQRVLEGGGVDVVQPDISLMGGIGQAKAVAMLCQLYNLRLSPHVWGGAIGLAAAVHFMAAVPPWPHSDNEPFPALLEYDVGSNALRDELLQTPIAYGDGHLTVPDGPGLGVALDDDAVRRFRLD